MNCCKLNRFLVVLLSTLTLSLLAGSAFADVVLEDLTWRVVGSSVEFHAFFHNTDPIQSSGPVNYSLDAQPYGAYVPSTGPICDGTIPDILPLATVEVICNAALVDLPPSAEVILPGGSPGLLDLATSHCDSLIVWNGNVDVFWTPSANLSVHFGTMYVCPGGGPSYIHIVMDCADPGGITWSFSALCPGFTATLFHNAGGVPGAPVVGPIPPGFFDGWICIGADATVLEGAVCYPQLDLMCAGLPETITVCTEACDWTGPTPVEPTTWGEIKRQNLNQDN